MRCIARWRWPTGIRNGSRRSARCSRSSGLPVHVVVGGTRAVVAGSRSNRSLVASTATREVAATATATAERGGRVLGFGRERRPVRVLLLGSGGHPWPHSPPCAIHGALSAAPGQEAASRLVGGGCRVWGSSSRSEGHSGRRDFLCCRSDVSRDPLNA